MSWTAPRTWVNSEAETASIMNTHIRDNMKVLVDMHNANGFPKTLLKGCAYSGTPTANVNANAAGSGQTELPGYRVTIPANYLKQPGDRLYFQGTFATSATNEAARIYLAIDTATKILTYNTTQVSTIPVLCGWFGYNTQTTGEYRAWQWYGAANYGAPLLAHNGTTALGTIDWATTQYLYVYLMAATALTITLTDWLVGGRRARTGDAAAV